MLSRGVLALRRQHAILLGCLALAAQPATAQCRYGSCASAFSPPGQNESNAPSPFDLRIAYTLDFISNVSGGIDTGTDVLGDLGITLAVDSERLFGWSAGRLFVYGLLNHGGDPSRRVGDVQVADNIEAPDTWKLYELWFQQNMLEGRASALVGLYDLNSEFDVIESAGLFINSSFGIGPEYGLSGRNGPSIFPATSLGMRVAARPAEALSGKLAVLDGVPGDPGDPHGTAVKLDTGDGALVAAELVLWLDGLGVERAERQHAGRGRDPLPYRGKFGLGAWHYTTDFSDAVTTGMSSEAPPTRAGSHGVYVLGEYRIGHERGLTVFGRLGWADPRVNRVSAYTGGGIVYRAPFLGSGEDRVGLAVAAAHHSSRYRRAREEAGSPVDAAEIAIEATCAVQLTSWLSLQPDVQYIINPGMEPGRSNAFVIGGRVTFEY